MRKLCIIVMLLLLWATGARATVWMEVSDTVVEPDENVTFSIFSDTDTPYGAILEIGHGELSPDRYTCMYGEWADQAQVFLDAGSDSYTLDLSLEGFPCYFYLEANSLMVPGDVKPGEHFRIGYTALEFGPETYVDISLYDFSFEWLQTIVLDQTAPEPATLMLLVAGIVPTIRRRASTVA